VELVAVLRGWRQPLFRNFPPGDFCGSGNIGCADYIGMIEMTTRSAQKQSTSKAIAFHLSINSETRLTAQSQSRNGSRCCRSRGVGQAGQGGLPEPHDRWVVNKE